MKRVAAGRLPIWGRALAGACGLLLGLATAAMAQYPVNPSVGVPGTPAPGTGINQLLGLGSVAQLGSTGFELTPGFPYQRGAVWLVNKQPVANGFQTQFQFRISNPGGLIQWSPFGNQQGGDGFAFVIQNYALPVIGPFAGYLGYHGIPNSLAVEFDTWWNAEAGFNDPSGNHISVHSRGQAANSVAEAASLGSTSAIPFMKDGATHTARIAYTPGVMQVFLDNMTTPALTVPVNLASLLLLDNGGAWMGFTSGTGSAYEAHDVLSWSFGPGPAPVSAPVTVTPTNPTTTPGTTTPPPVTGTTNPPFTFPPSGP